MTLFLFAIIFLVGLFLGLIYKSRFSAHKSNFFSKLISSKGFLFLSVKKEKSILLNHEELSRFGLYQDDLFLEKAGKIFLLFELYIENKFVVASDYHSLPADYRGFFRVENSKGEKKIFSGSIIIEGKEKLVVMNDTKEYGNKCLASFISSFENNPVSNVVCNKDFKIVHINKIFREFLFVEDIDSNCIVKVASDKGEIYDGPFNNRMLFEKLYSLQKNSAYEFENIVISGENIKESKKFALFVQDFGLNEDSVVFPCTVFKFINTDMFEKDIDSKIEKSKLLSLGKLAGGIAHEVNTPLTYIKGNLDILKYDIEDIKPDELKNEIKSALDVIDDGAEKIKSIIEVLREVAGSQSSQDTKESNIYETIVLAARMVYNRAKHYTNIYIDSIKYFPEEETLIIDKKYIKNISPGHLRQLWFNLFDNSIDAFLQSRTPFEYRKIEIEFYELGQGRLKVLFCDNAGGFPKYKLPNIFEPFSTNKNFGGIGLGLNICRSIVCKYDGEIKAYNQGVKAVVEIIL